MGQSEVLKLLKSKRKWMTSTELAEILGVNALTANKSLKQMFKFNEVTKRIRKKTNIIYYEYKHN